MSSIAEIVFETCVAQFDRRVAEFVADGVTARDAAAIVFFGAIPKLGADVAAAVRAEWEKRRG